MTYTLLYIVTHAKPYACYHHAAFVEAPDPMQALARAKLDTLPDHEFTLLAMFEGRHEPLFGRQGNWPILWHEFTGPA